LEAAPIYPKFEEGQIWWCYLGENIGHEENGKGDKFLRPVVILKKFNHRIFYAIPTSTQNKNNKY
jgi:mRNA interferase MazF